MSSADLGTGAGRPAIGDERAARLRRANLRLAVALGLFAAALYVGFVLSGIG